MTKPGANDLFGSFKAYATRVLGDEINPEKSAAALSGWLKDSSEVLRDKVEKEVERTVKKLGLAKQSEISELRKEIAALRREVSGKSVKANEKSATKKAPTKKTAKKAPAKKSAKKSTTKRTSKAGK
jgi:cell division septum initiation protein DivIVA